MVSLLFTNIFFLNGGHFGFHGDGFAKHPGKIATGNEFCTMNLYWGV